GWEPLHNPPDLPMYVRSRMGGVLGMSFQSAALADEDRAAVAKEVALYKTLRPTLADATAALLTDQPVSYAGPEWDALQESVADGTVVVYAFDTENGANHTTVAPVDLQPDVVYRVISADSGRLGEMTGADLMAAGIRIVRSPKSAAHVLSLIPQD